MVLCSLGLSAQPFRYDFSKTDGSHWTFVQWHGFKPFPEYKHENGMLHITRVQGKSGITLANHRKKLSVRAGDSVRIRFTAKGKGKFKVGLQYFSRKKFTACDAMVSRDLTGEWKLFELDLPVRDLRGTYTDQAMVTFGTNFQGEIFLKDFEVSTEKSRYAGNLPIPKKWVVFPDVKPDFVPDQTLLSSLPSVFGSVKGKEAELLSNTLDFARFSGRTGAKICSWAFAELEGPYDGYECTFGAGADWWMTFHVNGKSVYSTFPSGNDKHPIAMDNHLFNVKLKKGRNILAVKILSGNNSALFMLGGPKDLRNIVRAVRVTEVLSSDNFDKKLPRKNLFKLIQGNPAPGLMSLTGQGVYRAADKETILFSSRKGLSIKPDKFFVLGLRVQSFGEKAPSSGTLAFRILRGKEQFELQIRHDPAREKLNCVFLDQGKVVKDFPLETKKLPSDLLFAFRKEGVFIFTANSLADSTISSFSGIAEGLKKLAAGNFSTQTALVKTSSNPAEIIVDEYVSGYGESSTSSGTIPYSIEHKRTFDPVREKWPLVFSDEFSGSKVDESKWQIKRNKSFATVKDGFLHIKADYDSSGKNKGSLATASLWTREKFQYGYFEARLRFTQQPGWWAAFWLYGTVNANPFTDGFEIDIFEDYYNRPKRRGINNPGVLDHNLHVYCGSILKSWNYNSKLTKTLKDFYVLGCKWTPFEISYYLDGKLISSSAVHSPYDSVTFDAFHHSAGITGLHAIVSGQIMGKSWHGSWGSPAEGRFPEYYLVDYVRIYGYPQKDLPSVKLKNMEKVSFGKVGSILKFKTEVKVSSKTGAPVKAVYLFDNGYMIAYKDKAPYDFEIPFTETFYKTTRYTLPGRAKKAVPFDGYTHNFVVYVQDIHGNVAHTNAYQVIPFFRESKPYQGKPIPVPGVILQGNYDEGGQNVAYYDTSKGNYSSKTFRVNEDVDTSGKSSGFNVGGEWRKYTLNVAESAVYRARLRYGTPFRMKAKLHLLIDGKYAGFFPIRHHPDPNSWACDTTSEISLPLKKGIRVLTILIEGGYNLAELEILKK